MTHIGDVVPRALQHMADKLTGEPPERQRLTWAPEPVPPAVPKRFADVRFDNYVTEHHSETAALELVRDWVAAVVAGKPFLLALIGPQGCGKSHLLYAAAWALFEQKRRAHCASWYQLANALRYGHAVGPSRLESYEVRERLWDKKIILLDEVRPTAGTAFDDTELAMLTCHCYDHEIPVLLTTNTNPLAKVIGPAAASRFAQFTLKGRDRRQTETPTP